MKLEASPFRPGWWGISLANVGLGDQRPDRGTYGCYDYANLPPLPVVLDANFSWLIDAPKHEYHVGVERAAENSDALRKLLDACERTGILLPPSFLKFIQSPELQARVRSNTHCLLDLPEQPFPSPTAGGVLVQFLIDSQGCLFWYLYIRQGIADHCIVCSPDFYHPQAREAGYGEPDPDALLFCAESFEMFLCRFWLENELWYAAYDGTLISEAGRRYLAHYRKSPPHPMHR